MVSWRVGSRSRQRVSCGIAPESYSASPKERIGSCWHASRRTNFSWNQARWPISHNSGFTVGNKGPIICSSVRSATSCSVRSAPSSTQSANWSDRMSSPPNDTLELAGSTLVSVNTLKPPAERPERICVGDQVGAVVHGVVIEPDGAGPPGALPGLAIDEPVHAARDGFAGSGLARTQQPVYGPGS